MARTATKTNARKTRSARPDPRRTGRPPLGAEAGVLVALRLEPALLARVDAWARAAGATRSGAIREAIERLTAGPAPFAPAVDVDAVKAQVLAALQRFAAEEYGFVPVPRLRRAVAASREAFDRAALELQRDDRIALIPQNDLRDVPAGYAEDAIISPFGDKLLLVQRGAKG